MNLCPPILRGLFRCRRKLNRHLAVGLALLTVGASARGGNLTRSGSSSSSAASTSQTATAATTAAAQVSQAAALAQLARVSMQRSVETLQAFQAQQNAQSAARNLQLGPTGPNNLGTASVPLPNVPDGLALGGLVPGIAGTDTANLATAATASPITVNSNGTSSVTLGKGTAITLPRNGTGTSQVTVSGSGTVGTVTTGGTIKALTGGVATTIAPGSTISVTSAATLTFASGSAIPATFSTYKYGAPVTTANPSGTSAVPSSWTGIGGLTQSTYSPSGQSPGATAVTITQTSQQALLTWQTFNIGKHTLLDFDQSEGGADVANWVAINKVADNIAPSQILGSIQAPGQVYVINQNGIIFGGSSQVNVGALVASSLPINDNLVQQGLLNNPDYQFLFSQLDIPAGTQGPTPAFTPEENDPAPTANGNASDVVAHVASSGNLTLAPAAGQDGDVIVQAGAQLSSPANAVNVGGRVALVGPNVNNAGTISTPDGQTILAAGLQVGFSAHDANDPTLRGLDTYIGAVVDPSVTNPAFTAGTATNLGLIGTLTSSGAVTETPGADVTLAGSNVNQDGVIALSTSVSLNSRVDLLGDYGAEPFIAGVASFNGSSGFYPTATGNVTLGAGSVTALLPDLSSTATVVGTKLALPSLVNIQGAVIALGTNALLDAPSANTPSNPSQPALGVSGSILASGVTLDAGQWNLLGGEEIFSSSAGQVSLGRGASIDVSGSENVTASVAEDVVAVQLLGTELANSPLQQDGPLRGKTVYVDLRDVGIYDGTAWIGTPLADASGYVNLVQHTVGELTTAGGSVAINAGDSVLMQAGSTVNVSGGWINYLGGMVQTTNVISNGRLINIADATPNLIYSGVYNGFTVSDSKYGLSETYTSPSLDGMQYDPGYLQGGSGGSLAITAPAMTLNGTLYGNTVAGSQQRTAASVFDSSSSAYAAASFLPTLLATSSIPTQTSLSLSFHGESSYDAPTDPTTPQNVDFVTGVAPGDVVLPTQLTAADGFGVLSIDDPEGNITLPAGTPLTLPAGGSLSLIGANITIESSITVAGGTLAFTALEASPYDPPLSLTVPPASADSPAGAVSADGNFTLGASASLETGGLIVSDSGASSGIGSLPTLTNGGSVSIDGYSVFLRPNSQIDSSGGVYVTAAGVVTYGKAGSISILAGQDPNYSDLTGGQILLGSTLSAYSGLIGGGGALTLQAPLVQIGGPLAKGLQNGDSDVDIVREGSGVYGNGNTLWLDPAGTGSPDFFSQGGIESFTINGLGEIRLDSSGNQAIDPATGNPLFDPAVLIAPNTRIQPTAESYLLSAEDTLVAMSAAEESQFLPSERSPVNFSFNTLGVTNSLIAPSVLAVQGDIVMGLGSIIETDPQAISGADGVSFAAPNGTITLLGTVIAPGGTISVKGASDSTTILFADSTDALPTVELGSQSVLSTAGVVQTTLNTRGYTTGSVLNGGTISVKGNIVAEEGSILNVSGASGTLDVLPAQTGINPTYALFSPAEVPTVEASNAGSINLSGGQELFTDATLLGRAGGLSASGGSLSLSSGAIIQEGALDATLVVTQRGPTFVEPANGQMIGTVVTPTQPVIDPGSLAQIDAYFAADPNIFSSKSISGDTGNGGLAGGIQALTLNGTVDFSGHVTIATGGSITVGSSTSNTAGGVIYANDSVVLDAPYISLGLPFSLPSTPLQSQQTTVFPEALNPTYGPGTLTVDASSLANVGNLSLQDIGTVNFNTTLAHTAASVTKNDPVKITGNGSITSTSNGTITSADGSTTALIAGVATSVTAGSSVTLNNNGSITPAASGIIPSRDAGDIQGDGTFDVQGNISITAAQIYPPTESFFSIFAYDYNNVAGDSSVMFTRPLQSDTLPSLPFSAGGTLNVYASTITQDGVLRAPDGSINLGVGVASATPIDYFTGSGVAGQVSTTALPIPTTGAVTLGSTSITSVSQIDPNTGLGVDIPYGIINNSGDWIDPAGNDITSAGNGAQGLPAKAINLSGQSVVDRSGAIIDLRGGGDLFAYQFITGTGGTHDILSSNTSFAVIPGSATSYAPYAPYAVSGGLLTNGMADAGYANPTLTVGEQVYLNASGGLPAGVYTLLPARYALMAGAYLITPTAGSAIPASAVQANGSTYVSGYRFNSLSNSTAAAPLYTEFQVESQSVVRAQADYQIASANTYFPQTAATNHTPVPRLPRDAGQLVLVAGSLSLPSTAGSLLDSPAAGGLGGEVDIASASTEVINIDNSSNPGTVISGDLNLDSTELTDFGAESLLIGGYSTVGSSTISLGAVGSELSVPSSGGTITLPQGTPGDDLITVSGTGVVGTYTSDGIATSISGNMATAIPAGSIIQLPGGGTVTFSSGSGGAIPVAVSVAGTGVTATANHVVVNNAGETLSGADLILVSNQNLTVDAGSTITATASSTGGGGMLTLAGDGALLRVSSDSTAQIARIGVIASSGINPPDLDIASEAGSVTTIKGASVVLDSTDATSLSSSVDLKGTAVALDSGQISLELTTPATPPATSGLILSGEALANLQASARSLSLLSYSSIDIYYDPSVATAANPSGDLNTAGVIGGAAVKGVYPVGSLALHAADIRNFGGGNVTINAKNITLDNSPGGQAIGAAPGVTPGGTLTVSAQTIDLGSNALQIDQFAGVVLDAASEVVLSGLGTEGVADSIPTPSAFNVTGDLTINSPLVSGASAAASPSSTYTSFADEVISAQGSLTVADPDAAPIAAGDSGLGAELQLNGAGVSLNSNIVLHSGSVVVGATGAGSSDDVVVGAKGNIDVSGLAPTIYSLTKYTSGGSVTLNSANGDVDVSGAINVSAPSGNGTADSGAGNAGSFTVNAKNGSFTAGGTINGNGGVVTSSDGSVLSQGAGGIFSLDVGSLSSGNLDAIEAVLNPVATGSIKQDSYVGGFTQSQSIQVGQGSLTVDGVIAAATVNLSADDGSIEVTSTGRIIATAPENGLIDTTVATQTENGVAVTTLTHPGPTGGAITLAAGVTHPGAVDAGTGIALGSVVLDPGSLLSVAGLGFSHAGKGGSITLQAGSDINGTAPSANSHRQANGEFGSGVAVVNIQAGATIDLSVNAAAGEGDLTGTLILQAPQTADNSDVQVDPIEGAVIQASSIVVAGLYVQNANSTTTASLDGSTSAGGAPAGSSYETQAIANAETFTSAGNYNAMEAALVGSSSSGVSGALVIEPAEEIDNTQGGLILNNNWDFSQDRFGPDLSLPGILTLRTAGNLSLEFGASLTDGFDLTNVPTGENYTAPLMSGQSWSFNLIAGADLSSANSNQVIAGAGSFVLGQDAPLVPTAKLTSSQTLLSAEGDNFYQTVRTGSGEITIDAGASVEIENELATIYTAGTAVPNAPGFAEPVLSVTKAEGNPYSPQYSDEGGNVTISALGNIGHYTASGAADSSSEMPTSWLYRQGATANGQFVAGSSTSWWVNFSNFFEDVGALGGGNVSLSAGGSVVNVDASIPTNAQLPATDANGNPLAPNAANLVELGGGDLSIQAGINIDGGVYYVERGQGTLSAGNEVVTNSTRAAAYVTGGISSAAGDPYSWLPTTLFAGDASFNVSTNGNLLLGPVANPFLLPQNVGNGTKDKSYFSTYNPADAVNISSLSGTVQIQDDADTLGAKPGDGSLYQWYQNVYLASGGAATSQPFLQVVETSLPGSFYDAFTLMAPTLRATAFSADIDLVGSLLLSPSPLGTVDLVAAGSVNGFQPNTETSSVANWASSLINLSDANPANIPGVASPLSSTSKTTVSAVLSGFSDLFAESGATQGLNLQEETALHADIDGSPLHADDPDPVLIYAQNGSISGLTLFSGKFSDLVAGQNIQDIALYLQNANAGEISLVDAGLSLTAYDPDSLLRTEAQTVGNTLLGEGSSEPEGQNSGAPNPGDIQINGPGTLEVLAGQNITLGDGPSNTSGPDGTSNGTDTGITSVGNERDPTLSSLASAGADIVVGAGLGGVTPGLSGATPSRLGFAKFDDEFLNPTDSSADPGGAHANVYLPDLGNLLGLTNASNTQVWTAFNRLALDQRDALALQVYYLVLRDAGRAHNSSSAPGDSTYALAKEAIAALFPQAQYQGNISLSSREIATVAGGDVDLFAPGGGVTVGFNLTDQPADQGVLTEGGGNINIFTSGDVTVGTSRIFTLDSGNIVIYSSTGNIAAGASSKTVLSAPPTRVLVDPQSGAVQTDLAGLATGGGIGVLESQAGAQAGDVDLIAPEGIVDAGDAGIRVSGNLNIAAVQVLNAGNISVGGKSAGVPTVTAPNLAGLAAASSAAGAGANEATTLARQQQQQAANEQSTTPSVITVEVLGYGGGDSDGA